jgi:alkylated DNA repair dioxygenase AlkB
MPKTVAPNGLLYFRNLLTPEEEKALLKELLDSTEYDTEWKTAGARANRRVRHFGYNYPYTRKLQLTLADPIPPSIVMIISKLLKIPGLKHFKPSQAIINRYLSGEGITKHIDHTELFGDTVVSVSLGCSANMVFRKDSESYTQTVTPGSAYAMIGESRYEWTHEMSKRKSQCDTRFSITFRDANMKYLKPGQIPHPPVQMMQIPDTVAAIAPVVKPLGKIIKRPKVKAKAPKIAGTVKVKAKAVKPVECTCCSDKGP